jgi:hypothetical protein
MCDADELRRILNGPRPGETAPGLLADFHVECRQEAEQVLKSARDVLLAALGHSAQDALTLEQWRAVLPTWFVEKFAPEISMDEAVRRRSLPMEERARLAENWSLGAWVHWLKPSERQWVWWDAEVTSTRLLRVKVVVGGFPFPSGSLKWLFECSGASSFELLE